MTRLHRTTWEYAFLTRIADKGGSLLWTDLSKGDTMRGTMLEKRGLCAWSQPYDRHAKKGSMTRKLMITPEGLKAIGRNAA